MGIHRRGTHGWIETGIILLARMMAKLRKCIWMVKYFMTMTGDLNSRVLMNWNCALDARGHPRYVFKGGSIDEFGVWRRALTEAEIAEAMKGFLAVSPKDKVATTWGDIKQRTITDE